MHAAVVMMAGVIAAGPALACMPEVMAAEKAPRRGAQCAVEYRPGGVNIIGLGPAVDMGNDIVVQAAFDTTGCSGEAHLVVSDCAADKALVLGTYNWVAMDGTEEPNPLTRLEYSVRDAVAQGLSDVLAVAEERARGLGLTHVLRVAPRDRIDMNGTILGLGCGCRTYYPG
jgi:hypothetical protein